MLWCVSISLWDTFDDQYCRWQSWCFHYPDPGERSQPNDIVCQQRTTTMTSLHTIIATVEIERINRRTMWGCNSGAGRGGGGVNIMRRLSWCQLSSFNDWEPECEFRDLMLLIRFRCLLFWWSPLLLLLLPLPLPSRWKVLAVGRQPLQSTACSRCSWEL